MAEKGMKGYFCITGIDTEQTNDTLFNYLEAVSNVIVLRKESLRTEEDWGHAVVVFQEYKDIDSLRSACAKKNLGTSSLKFTQADPPKSVIASSEDPKFNEDVLKSFLTKKKKEFVRVSTTPEGAISARLANEKDVQEILKDPSVKISRCKVTISAMYNCDHGTYWDKSLHTLSIPIPFKAPVPDPYIKTFLIDIQPVCNGYLEQHHAKLTEKEKQIYIECIVQPQDIDARQKVIDWQRNAQRALDEFVKGNAAKRELQVSRELKDLLKERVNELKYEYRAEPFKIISPDEIGSMKFVFIGNSNLVEKCCKRVIEKKTELEKKQKRKKNLKTVTVTEMGPLEVVLMKKEHQLEELCDIGEDLSYDADEESGIISLTGVEDDINKAKVKIYEIKNSLCNFRLTNLSKDQCKILKSRRVFDLVNEEFSNINISLVFKVSDGEVTVCSTCDNKTKIESVIKGLIIERTVALDAPSKAVISFPEWVEKRDNLESKFENVCLINDHRGDKIVVTCTRDISDKVIGEIEEFVGTNSIYEDDIKIQDEMIFNFLRKYRGDWFKQLMIKHEEHRLHITLGRNPIKIKGSKFAIGAAKSDIQSEIRKIKSEKYQISKPAIHLAFSNADNIIQPVERESKTLISVNVQSPQNPPVSKRKNVKQSEEDFATDQAFKGYKRDTKQQKPAGQPPKTGPLVCSNGTTITLIKKSDIALQQADVIVCSTNALLDMSGPAGKSLVRGAGQQLQNDIKAHGEVNNGDIVVFNGYNLRCQEVYLAALPSWSPGGEQFITKCVNDCLQRASSYGSIVFPAFGTGNFGYPKDLVARKMYECIRHHDKSNTFLKDVKILVYDTDTIKAFEQEELKQLNPNYQPQAFGGPAVIGPYKKNNVTVTLVKGDLGTQNVEVLVAAVPRDLKLENAGGAGKSLINGLGHGLQQDITRQYHKGVHNGELAAVKLSTPGTCKCVYLTSLVQWKDEKNVKDDEKQIWKFLSKCLETAEQYKCTSIGIPAMGTGGIGYPHHFVAETMYKIVDKFAKKHRHSKLKDIRFVLYAKDRASIKAFDSEQNKWGAPKPIPSQFNSAGDGSRVERIATPKTSKVIKNQISITSASFKIYFDSDNDLSKAKRLLDDTVSGKYKNEHVRDSLLTEMTENEIGILSRIADGHVTEMTVDTGSGEVTLYGVSEVVTEAKQDIIDLFRKIRHTRHCKAEAVIIQEQVQWYLKETDANGLPELIPYPDMINMYLETAYKGESGRTEVEFKDDKGVEYVIVLKDMREYLKKDRKNKVDVIRREKVIGSAGSIEPPVEWDDQGTDNIKVVGLLPRSKEFKDVEKKFVDSVFSGRPEWASQFNKSTFKVTRVERIQNINLWQMYAAKRNSMEQQNPKGTQNERLLWHGTPEAAVDSINYYGFNRSYCKDNSGGAWYGDGVYFSTDASYSARDFLAAPGPLDRNVYLCKVLTGVPTQGIQGIRVLPTRKDGTMLNYDSATDNKYTPPVEYVIFNDTQAYPQYHIKFKP